MKSTLLLAALFLCMSVVSQNYYASDTARGTNVTFKNTSVPHNTRVVSNVANTRTMKMLQLKDGTQAVPDSYRCLQSNDMDDAKLYNIIRSNFTTAELEKLKQAKVSLLLYIVIEPTGEISEVAFLFSPSSLLATIHPDTYYRVEQAVKAQIRFTLDAKTREYYPWIPDGLFVKFSEL